MGVGPIPLTAMLIYVDRYGLPEWALDALMQIDSKWLEMVNADG